MRTPFSIVLCLVFLLASFPLSVGRGIAAIHPQERDAIWSARDDGFFNRDQSVSVEWGLGLFGTKIGAGSDKPDYVAGEPVIFRITFTNQTDQTIESAYEMQGGYLPSISLFVVDSGRQIANVLPQYLSPKMGNSGNYRVAKTSPYGWNEWIIRLDRIFKLEPGKTYYAYAKIDLGRTWSPPGAVMTLTSGNAVFSILGNLGDTNNGAATPVTSIIPNASKVLPPATALPDTTASSAVTAAVKRPNALPSSSTSFSTAQDDTANPTGGSAATQTKPVLAQFSEPTQHKLFAFGILLLCCVALLTFILLRARSRVAGVKPQSSSRN